MLKVSWLSTCILAVMITVALYSKLTEPMQQICSLELNAGKLRVHQP